MKLLIAGIGLSLLPYGLITDQGRPFRWNVNEANYEADYYINETNQPYTGVTDDVQSALSTWNTVNPSILAYSYQGITSSFGFSMNGQSSISWGDPNNELPGGVLAATVPWRNGFTHTFGGSDYWTIPEMDMVFNNGIGLVPNSQTGGGCNQDFSVEAIALHEAGHGFGLDHPDQVDPNYTGGYNGAVMYSSIAPCDGGKATLRSDDRAGINFLYGANVAAPIAEFTVNKTEGSRPITVIFQNQTQGVVSTYTWDFGDSVTSNEINPEHEYLYKGVYSVTLTAEGPGGQDVMVKQEYITVNGKDADPTFFEQLGCTCTVAPRDGLPIRGLGVLAVLGGLAGLVVIRRRRANDVARRGD